MRIVHIASEVAPYSQTGGLADVLGGLPAAQRALDSGAHEVVVFTPLYHCVRERFADELCGTGIEIEVSFPNAHYRAKVVSNSSGSVFFVDVPQLYDREGLYGGGDEGDYPDNALRFATLCKVAIEAAPRVLGQPPEVLHAHDWQTGLVPAFVKDLLGEAKPPALAFTIHNLAYQGVFPKSAMTELGMDWSHFKLECLEFYDQLSMLKAGVCGADAVTTVSPSYAQEITTPEHGCGLDGFLKHSAKRLTGILNGIDAESWNPATDVHLPARYQQGDMSGKAECRRALCEELHLQVAQDELLIAIVSRFAYQKGLDLIVELNEDLAELGVHLLILGTGDKQLEERFVSLSARAQTRLHAHIGFKRSLARRLYAGCDALLMPSRFEPCGLNQLYAMRYGTIPIVHSVGGLRDTVRDPGKSGSSLAGATGFCFEHPDVEGLKWAVGQASTMFRTRPKDWQTIMQTGMSQDLSWASSARRYLALYKEIL